MGPRIEREIELIFSGWGNRIVGQRALWSSPKGKEQGNECVTVATVPYPVSNPDFGAVVKVRVWSRIYTSNKFRRVVVCDRREPSCTSAPTGCGWRSKTLRRFEQEILHQQSGRYKLSGTVDSSFPVFLRCEVPTITVFRVYLQSSRSFRPVEHRDKDGRPCSCCSSH